MSKENDTAVHMLATSNGITSYRYQGVFRGMAVYTLGKGGKIGYPPYALAKNGIAWLASYKERKEITLDENNEFKFESKIDY